jgi:hypothetical protein
MVSWFGRRKISPIHVMPGDSIRLRYVGKNGRVESITEPLTKAATYDTMAVGEIENELGFADGLVAVIGNEM